MSDQEDDTTIPRDQMQRAIIRADLIINGERPEGVEDKDWRQYGIVLLAFPFLRTGMLQYASNGVNRADLVAMMKATAERFERLGAGSEAIQRMGLERVSDKSYGDIKAWAEAGGILAAGLQAYKATLEVHPEDEAFIREVFMQGCFHTFVTVASILLRDDEGSLLERIDNELRTFIREIAPDGPLH